MCRQHITPPSSQAFIQSAVSSEQAQPKAAADLPSPRRVSLQPPALHQSLRTLPGHRLHPAAAPTELAPESSGASSNDQPVKVQTTSLELSVLKSTLAQRLRASHEMAQKFNEESQLRQEIALRAETLRLQTDIRAQEERLLELEKMVTTQQNQQSVSTVSAAMQTMPLERSVAPPPCLPLSELLSLPVDSCAQTIPSAGSDTGTYQADTFAPWMPPPGLDNAALAPRYPFLLNVLLDAQDRHMQAASAAARASLNALVDLNARATTSSLNDATSTASAREEDARPREVAKGMAKSNSRKKRAQPRQ